MIELMIYFVEFPPLTCQVLFIHAVTGRLHGHLQHPNASIVRGQYNLVWCAPINVKNTVAHIATNPHAADHLDLNVRKCVPKHSLGFLYFG